MSTLLIIGLLGIVIFISNFLGFSRGLKKGVSVGKEFEFFIFATAINKLRIQTRYVDLFDDVKKQYAIEENNLIQELRK